jgi:hypothetical protein
MCLDRDHIGSCTVGPPRGFKAPWLLWIFSEDFILGVALVNLSKSV